MVQHLLERDPQMRLSVSYTTRAPREGEIDGREYHFIDLRAFLAMRDAGEFTEWAQVHGNYYGTSKIWLQSQLDAGQDTVLEIDWQGAQQVRKAFPQAVGVFILPPSMDTLEARLRGRGTDSDEVIERRLLAARDEMRHIGEFEYVILNNDLSIALEDLCAIVRAARLRNEKQRQRHQSYFAFLEQD